MNLPAEGRRKTDEMRALRTLTLTAAVAMISALVVSVVTLLVINHYNHQTVDRVARVVYQSALANCESQAKGRIAGNARVTSFREFLRTDAEVRARAAALERTFAKLPGIQPAFRRIFAQGARYDALIARYWYGTQPVVFEGKRRPTLVVAWQFTPRLDCAQQIQKPPGVK